MHFDTNYIVIDKDKKETSPSTNAICIMLAGGNHAAGVLLASIVYWSKYGRAKIPKFGGYWVANKRTWWMREACLSSDQFNRAINRLEQSSLIERCQYWFSNRNILHVRPTKKTMGFVQSAKTWKAAKEFYADLDLIHSPENGGNKHLSSVNMQKSNEIGIDATPSLAKPLISKDISNLPDNPNNKPTGAHAATPLCAATSGLENKQPDFGTKQKKKNSNLLPPALQDDCTTTKQVAAVWSEAMKKHFSAAVATGDVSPVMTPKDLGLLAQMIERLGSKYENPEVVARDILAYMIEQWLGLKLFGKPTFPGVAFASDHLGELLALVTTVYNEGTLST